MVNRSIGSQWSPVARFTIVLASGVIVIAGLKASAAIIAPLLFAIFLAMQINPMLERLRQRGLPSWLAFLILFLTVLLIGLGVIFFVYVSLLQLESNVPVYQENLSKLLKSIESALAAQGLDLSDIEAKDALSPQVVAKASTGILGGLISELTAVLLVLLFLIFLLSEAPDFPNKARLALGVDHPVVNRMATFGENVRLYMSVRTIISIFIGITFTILLLVLGVDLAVFWGFLAFILSFIPTIGLILAAVPAIILALLEQGITTASIIIIGVLILNGISDNAIMPRLSAYELQLSPFVTFFSFMFWVWVLGPIGGILSAVLTFGIKAVFEGFAETQGYAVLLGRAAMPDAPSSDAEDFE